ncbi:MipA/OmpV family protein [Marinomonas sp.]|uniref:MipA/OmpV family protein n=1 Tax=Marinomonas sp. TaxID=1904862 RepID=UPI003BAA7951
MAFASYRIGFISTKLSQDISGKHDGYSAKISAGVPFPVGTWRVIPSISYEFIDSKMGNHMFGVSQQESTNTGGVIPAYDTGSVSRIQYGVRGIYPVSKSTNIMLGISHTKYDDDILKSPIIENDEITSFLAGVLFSF